MKFLSRVKVEEARLMSRAVNSAVASSATLPHRRRESLQTGTWPSEEQAKVKDGFITGSFGGLLDGSYTMAGKAFNDIFKFRFCCRELKDKSNTLVGELIFPTRADNEIVAFKLTLSATKKVALRVENRLGVKTAFALLHFLHHANQYSYFDTVETHFDRFQQVEDGAMNAKLLKSLASFSDSGGREPVFKLRGLRLTACLRRIPIVSLDAVSVRVAQQLIAYRSLLWGCLWPIAMAEALIFNSGGKELATNIEVRKCVQPIDRLVRMFTNTPHNLRREAIPKVTIKRVRDGIFVWPTSCPNTEAHKSSSCNRYIFKKRNKHGDKLRFQVTLLTRFDDQGVEGVTEAAIEVL